jgi:hypothetical protein
MMPSIVLLVISCFAVYLNLGTSQRYRDLDLIGGGDPPEMQLLDNEEPLFDHKPFFKDGHDCDVPFDPDSRRFSDLTVYGDARHLNMFVAKSVPHDSLDFGGTRLHRHVLGCACTFGDVCFFFDDGYVNVAVHS